MNYKHGFIVPLLLVIIAVLVIGGGGYVYMQNKQANQSATTSPTAQTSQTANWKTYKANIGGDVNPPSGSFSFQYPSGWFICKNVSDTEYVTVSDDCSSSGGKPYTYPTNYFEVRNIGVLDLRDLRAGILKSDTGWHVIRIDANGATEPMRSIYYQPKDIDLVLVGLNLSIQSTLDEISSTFKINP